MPFNPRSLRNLRKIVDKTNGQIVLTSSWKRSKACMTVLNARLKEYGLKVFSETESLQGKRGMEIAQWIMDNDNIIDHEKDTMIILDDEIYDIRNIYEDIHIVLCSHFDGLNWRKTREALRKVKRQEHIQAHIRHLVKKNEKLGKRRNKSRGDNHDIYKSNGSKKS